MIDGKTGGPESGQIASFVSSPHVSSGLPSLEHVSLANKPTIEKKASTYAEVVKKMNDARERGLPFKVRPHSFYLRLVVALLYYILVEHLNSLLEWTNLVHFNACFHL